MWPSGRADGEPFAVAEAHDGGLAAEADVREVSPCFAEIGAAQQMRLAGDDEAILGISLIGATPGDGGDAAVFLRPDVALANEHLAALRWHELGGQSDGAVVHGEGLRFGIEDRRFADQPAVRLQARPTRWPEDAPIGEAHEFLWRIAVLFGARHGLPGFARVRAAAHDVRLQQGIAALRIADQKQTPGPCRRGRGATSLFFSSTLSGHGSLTVIFSGDFSTAAVEAGRKPSRTNSQRASPVNGFEVEPKRMNLRGDVAGRQKALRPSMMRLPSISTAMSTPRMMSR